MAKVASVFRKFEVRTGLTLVQQTALLAVLASSALAAAGTITECRRLLLSGNYSECLDQAREATERRAYGEDWPLVRICAERELGLYEDALATAEAGMERYPWSIRILVEKNRCLQDLGRKDAALQCLTEIDRLASATPWRYSDADDLVSLGQAALLAGADPKDVLEGFFDRARRNFSRRADGYLASAQLAIEKGDVHLAVEILEPAVDRFPRNPEILFAWYLAIRESNPAAAEASRQEALRINPSLAAAILVEADSRIDREQFDVAVAALASILNRNSRHPEAGALLAAIHLLQNQTEAADRAKSKALELNPQNPAVYQRIGTTLSRRYRFAEGAKFQRQALKCDEDFLPAQAQLAQDLLRLGHSDEAWALAEQAQMRDGYNTHLFNLLQLRDSLDRFAALQNDRFIVQMSREEAGIFGDQVIDLLSRAWDDLVPRYGFSPEMPVYVEIFDRPDDFAVRTFGLPDVADFLGVCFGKVITANSPTSQRSSPSNWKSVLWHEFCHVITLQMTSNRIPRWLSEGISVYEERRRDPRWGQQMSPEFRQMILEGQLTSVSRLSSAFLNVDSGEAMNFAYYQSSMVVEFLVEEFGFETLTSVLRDLNTGLLVNDALARRTVEPELFDRRFALWLIARAQMHAPGVEFGAESLGDTGDIRQYAREHPQHYRVGLLAARQIVSASPEVAEAELLRLIELFPEDTSSGSARRVLADLYRQQGRSVEESRVLAAHLARTADDLGAAVRLMDLRLGGEDWSGAVECGTLILAIDPGSAPVLRKLANAAERSGRTELAVRCLRGLLQLDRSAVPRWRLRIARLIRSGDPAEARRQTLLALEEAPRFREAHQLLLDLSSAERQDP